jgi:hypothetical protein
LQARARLQTLRRRRDPAQALQYIQSHALQTQQLVFSTLGAKQHVARLEDVAILFLQRYLNAALPQQVRIFFKAGRYARLARHHVSHGRATLDPDRRYGQIARSQIRNQQGIEQRAQNAPVYRIFQRQASSAE